MKKSIIFLSLIFVLSGCDVVMETLQKGSIEGYLKCVSNNEDKANAISSRYVQTACAVKHSKTTDDSRGFLNGCGAQIILGSKPKINIPKCKNDTNKIITSIQGWIKLENLENQDDIKLKSDRATVFIEPKQTVRLELEVKGSKLKSIEDYDSIPGCGQVTEGPCKSWGIQEYSYIEADI